MIYIWPNGDVHDEPYEWLSDDYFTIPEDTTVDAAVALVQMHFGPGEQYENVVACVLQFLGSY